ncbi:zf-C3HC-domain-containing protein [Polyporus arcularius HHB13444]|uniref:Zf-C3HC-domain-containing protein n=1 Tax=Polyporus arcularius HHB13444 TaxID=1314778 RepID=A0A5C3P5W8_9APHY|nr:zf-C3HC-domain-containing protein [Polyporus arcularius HHB13444]
MSATTEQSVSTIITPTPTAVPSSSDKSLKRKLEDALQTLDEAVGPTASPTTATQRPPLKRLRTSRSIYAMLTKYGIKKDPKPTPAGDLEKLSKTAPHLAAILSRTASRTRNALPIRLGSRPPQTSASSLSDYRPSSTQSFLSRLATYKLSTYGNKPAAIDAVAASKCGWINDGKDRLVCGLCGVSWVVASRDGMTREAANALVEKQRAQLVHNHKDGCPWKTRQCDDSIYHIPLQAPLTTIREIKARAILLDSVMQGVAIKHPLTAAQVQSLTSIVSSVSLPSSSLAETSEPSTPTDDSPSSASTASASRAQPSETAILTAVFGWAILPPAPPEPSRTPSISRAASVAPGSPRRTTPSRASSVARESTPTPTSTRSSLRISASTSLLSLHSVPSGFLRPDTALLHCPLCQRRVGLWAFLPKPAEADDPMMGDNAEGGSNKKQQPQRQLDILREHRPYCPYVVRSTVLPSLPTPSPTAAQANGHQRSSSLVSLASSASTNGSSTQVNAQPGAMEGWRAVMAVVSRYGNVQRQRLGLNRVPSGRPDSIAEGAESADGETNSIEAMVADVKSHGGKDLLKYVKGLLG